MRDRCIRYSEKKAPWHQDQEIPVSGIDALFADGALELYLNGNPWASLVFHYEFIEVQHGVGYNFHRCQVIIAIIICVAQCNCFY